MNAIGLSGLSNAVAFKQKESPGLSKQEDRIVPGALETVAVSATFTAEFLAEPFLYWMKELELPATMEFAPYGQVFQQLLDANSLLATNQRGLNVVLVRLEDWATAPAAYNDEDAPAFEAGIERSVREFTLAVKTAASRGATQHLVCLCPSSRTMTKHAERTEMFRHMEKSITGELAGLNSVYLITPEDLFELYPVSDYYDPSGDELGHVPYTPEFFAALATMIARRLHALKRAPLKVIALDCDQTLWTGVCGEDGPDGVRLDPPRRALQEFFRAQLDAGRLLCLCSKNNEEDVVATFERHREMPLQKQHFAASRINWRPKSENLRALAQELNLGLESFVLVDDNPMECAEVTANCPEVLALQLPTNLEVIPQFLKHCWVFDRLKTTAEDRQRTAFYQQNQQREELRKDSLSLSQFLAALELKIAIRELSDDQIARVAQLIQRTNQFNTTTRRRTEGELQALRQRECEVLTVTVSDRFGDYGLVGAMVFGVQGSSLLVDSLLLSCRVLGKGVEHRMLSHLGQVARERHLSAVEIQFTPSAKNKPALAFLENVGAPFRQELNSGSVFSFPVEDAARIIFHPGNTDQSERPAEETPQLPAGAHPANRFERWRWIALEANDAHQILQLVKAKTGKRARATIGGEPRTEIEKQLCEIWQDLLGIERVGIHDDFFELGGNSLLAVRLFAQIERLTGKRLPVVTIFQSPTIERLAAILNNSGWKPPTSSLVAIQPEGSKPPFFCLPPDDGTVLMFADLARHLGKDQPFYGLEPVQLWGKERVNYYVEQIQAFQPKGPYYLGGRCGSGFIALQMARELIAKGEKVALLALLGSGFPPGFKKPRLHEVRRLAMLFWQEPSYLFKPRNLWYAFQVRSFAYKRRARKRLAHIFSSLNAGRFRGLWKTPVEINLDIVNTAKEIKSDRYPGRITLFETNDHTRAAWMQVAAGGVDCHLIATGHMTMLREPYVQTTAAQLKTSLDAARAET
jgi:FkbH-like protein